MKFRYNGRVVEASSKEAAIRKIVAGSMPGRGAVAASGKAGLEIVDILTERLVYNGGHPSKVSDGHGNPYKGRKFPSFKAITSMLDRTRLKGRGEDTYWSYYTDELEDGKAILHIEVDVDAKGRVVPDAVKGGPSYTDYMEVTVSAPGKSLAEIKDMLEGDDIITGIGDSVTASAAASREVSAASGKGTTEALWYDEKDGLLVAISRGSGSNLDDGEGALPKGLEFRGVPAVDVESAIDEEGELPDDMLDRLGITADEWDEEVADEWNEFYEENFQEYDVDTYALSFNVDEGLKETVEGIGGKDVHVYPCGIEVDGEEVLSEDDADGDGGQQVGFADDTPGCGEVAQLVESLGMMGYTDAEALAKKFKLVYSA